jgi:hypothetical protein
LEEALLKHLIIYNQRIPQQVIGHQTPMQAVQKGRQDKPDLFANKEYNQTGLDMDE